MNRPLRSGLLAAGLALLPALAITASAQSALPLSGPAYVLAEEAYRAYARGDFDSAVAKAREALRLRPDVPQLKALLDKAQSAQRARTAAASKPVRPRKPEPSAPRVPEAVPAPRTVAPPPAPDPAFVAADSAYRSYGLRDYAAAAGQARQAVQLAPTRSDYWLLLVNSLAAADRLAEAEQAIEEGIRQAGEDDKLLAQRTDIRRRLLDAQVFGLARAAYRAFDEGEFVLAAQSIQRALQLAPGNRDHQLLLVNALSRSGQIAEAEQALTVALAMDGDRSQDAPLLAQRGAIRQRLGRHEAAKEDYESALRIGRLPVVTEIGLLVDLDRKQDAKRRFEEARASGAFAQVPDTEVAYLAARVGDDEAALASFNRADAAGKLPNRAYPDAAFAALRAHRDAEAIAFFKRSLDAGDSLDLKMDPQMRFDTRRAVAEVSRETGVIASLTYRGAVSGLGVEPGTGTDNLQAGIEAYWRPLGYRGGRPVELFVRAFETLYSKNGGATGAGTFQGALGVRYKPFTQANLVASLSRVYSRTGRSQDWLAQLGFSDATGDDLRVDVPAWWTTRFAAEAGRYLEARQDYAFARVEAGRSFRPGGGEGRWILFPHLSVAADYDSAATERGSLGFGPGIGARYWFREDAHHAPRSHLDLMLGYRARLAGAERAKGVFLTVTVSY